MWLHVPPGTVPSRNPMYRSSVHVLSAGSHVLRSTGITCTPSGAENGFTSEYCGSLIARLIKSPQIGAAVSAPCTACVRSFEMSV